MLPKLTADVANTLLWQGFKLELLDLNRYKNGRWVMGYRLWDNGELIFEGDDYSPSPCYATDGLDSMMELLDFLTLMPGDTDDEYFKDYSERQLQWVKEWRTEELRTLAYDYEILCSGQGAQELRIRPCKYCGQETLIYMGYLADQNCLWCGKLVRKADKA